MENAESLNLIELKTDPALEKYKLHRRFDRMGRLVGDAAMKKLMDSHVMVIGLGGVGSWAAEAVIRSGVGEVSIVDFDEICITNFNRQMHSLNGLVGKEKTAVMKERLEKINPQAKIHAIPMFYNAQHCEAIFGDSRFSRKPDFVIDAIDNMTAKAHLLNYCKSNGIPVVCCTGSGGRMDPAQVKVTDLALTEVDPLARNIRRILREKYGFSSQPQKPFGIPAVYSNEPARAPMELTYDEGKGFKCVCPQGENPYFQCDNRNLIMGNAGFVTGTFGFMCASVAIRTLIGDYEHQS